MARERGRRRRAEEEAEPVVETVEPLPAAEGGRTRPARTPGGPSFALPVAFVAGLGAAVLAFLGAAVVARTTGGGGGGGGDTFGDLDKGGIQAARMLTAADIDRWREDFGTTKAIRDRFDLYKAGELEKLKDVTERNAADAAFDAFRKGSQKPFRPGFDVVFPPNDAKDTLIKIPRTNALKLALEQTSDALLGAAIYDGGGTEIVGWGARGTPPGKPLKTLGQTEVFAASSGGKHVRVYVHPMRDRAGAPAGKAMVFLQAGAAAAGGGDGSMAAAGAAAGAAFLGAFALALLLCLGPVKAMRKLAADTEALARGEFGTRVTVSGPDIVQAAAKNVQRLGAVAAAGAAAQAVPQVIEQQVIVQPVQEVQEGLAPLRGFRRPDEFEIEATQKVCPDLGNDYHDAINVDEERVGLFLADIPNLRGVRGALYMAQVRALFRAAAPGEASPAEVLKKVNRAFAQDLPRGVYVTAMYCVVERSTGICKVASAQHLPLVFWKMAKKASAKLQPEGIALGLDPGQVFDKTIAEKAVQIDRGDRIVLHTDGAIAARNAAGVQYGEERFYYVLNREAPKNSAACVNLIANDMDLFHEGAPQMDDFTIVTLRRVK